MTASDQRVRDTFVALSDTLVDDFDVIDFLHMLSERCVELLDVTAAGVLLADHRGGLGLAAASTEQTRLLELFQLQSEEGPCLESYESGEAVPCPSLAEAVDRWPRFAPAAADAGFGAVLALPMRLREQVIGGINLFSATPGELSSDVVSLARALANVATIGILQERAHRHREVVVEQLETALNSRIVIEQAKGVLAEHLQVSMTEAFTMLRRYARSTKQRLVALSAAVVDGYADIADIADRAGTAASGDAASTSNPGGADPTTSR